MSKKNLFLVAAWYLLWGFISSKYNKKSSWELEDELKDSREKWEGEFKILFDDNNIYVAIKALDTEAEKINKRMSRRDGWEGEFAGIQLDSYYDKRTGFVFVVSAAGIKNDAIISNDGDNFDMSWDPIWFVKTSIDDKGWYAEMKIPLSQLRFSKNDEQTWGLQIVRKIHRNDEFTLWQAFSDEEPGWVSKYGDLKGIKKWALICSDDNTWWFGL